MSQSKISSPLRLKLTKDFVDHGLSPASLILTCVCLSRVPWNTVGKLQIALSTYVFFVERCCLSSPFPELNLPSIKLKRQKQNKRKWESNYRLGGCHISSIANPDAARALWNLLTVACDSILTGEFRAKRLYGKNSCHFLQTLVSFSFQHVSGIYFCCISWNKFFKNRGLFSHPQRKVKFHLFILGP